MNGQMTYRELHAKLLELGYSCRIARVNGKQGEVFDHESVPNAMIVLPERKPEQLAEPFYMGSVLGILKSRGIIQEQNPLLS